MILVTGGFYQGKRAFIQKNYPREAQNAVYGDKASFEEMLKADCILSLEEWIKREALSYIPSENSNLETYFADKIKLLIRQNPNAVIELAEVGCGLVPLDAGDRAFRESTGRVGCLLAEASREVYRLVMGIPVKLK